MSNAEKIHELSQELFITSMKLKKATLEEIQATAIRLGRSDPSLECIAFNAGIELCNEVLDGTKNIADVMDSAEGMAIAISVLEHILDDHGYQDLFVEHVRDLPHILEMHNESEQAMMKLASMIAAVQYVNASVN